MQDMTNESHEGLEQDDLIAKQERSNSNVESETREGCGETCTQDTCTCKENRAAPKTLKVGDFVSWSDGAVKGEVMEIVEDGSISVPNSSVTINGTFSDPAALVAVYEEANNGWVATGVYVGKKFSSLMRINELPEAEEMDNEEGEADSYDFNGDRQNAIIIDLDRTLFRGGGMNSSLINYLNTFDDTDTIIVTARVEARRSKTIEELAGFDYDLLIMRPSAGDDSVEYKSQAAKELLARFNIMLAIDDNVEMLNAYRRLGITAILPTEVPETEQQRDIALEPPAYMRAAARRGLEYYERGLGGDGLVEATIREARAMASGSVTADKWVRLRAWISRHLDDLDAPDANPESDGYPSAGVVAHLLWGSGPSKRSAQRALDYADGVVSRIEAENEGRAKGEALSKIETRVNSTEFEIREESDGMRFSGYAAVFDSPSEPLPFIERIQRGAFRKSLRARNDVKFLWNHDTGEILGSSRAKTLTLTEDERGLKVEGVLPNTSRGRDVAELLKRGDIDSMSFGFSVPSGGDTWNSDGSERTLKSVRLHEVSLVAFPAYPGTAGLQSVRGLDKVALRAEVDADALADALLKIEDGQDISADEKVMLSRVIDQLAPDAEPAPTPELNEGMLLLKKKKLELLLKGL